VPRRSGGSTSARLLAKLVKTSRQANGCRAAMPKTRIARGCESMHKPLTNSESVSVIGAHREQNPEVYTDHTAINNV
jgi:hypothetical protein